MYDCSAVQQFHTFQKKKSFEKPLFNEVEFMQAKY